MKTYLKKTTDPQMPIAARFGEEADDGTIEWGERQDIRILISENRSRGNKDEEADWFLTPMTLDGRPLNMTFVGGNEGDGTLLREQNTDHVLQILKIASPRVVRQGVANGDLESEMDAMDLQREDLSPLGRAIYDAVTDFEDQVSNDFVERMVEELPTFHD